MKKLKNKYEEWSIKPNERAWEQIEQKLDKKRKTFFPMLWRCAAAVVLFVIGLSVFWFNDDRREEVVGHPMIKTEQKVEKPTSEVVLMNPNISKAKQKEIIIAPAEHKAMNIEKKTLSPVIKQGETLINPVPEPIGKVKDSPKIARKVEYTTADDLLFGAEAQRLHNEQGKSKSRMGKITLPQSNIKPQSIEILGIKIYESKTEE